MGKNFFLEGPVRQGKSTLIRECLKEFPELKVASAGFFTQRLLGEDNLPRGFRLLPAASSEPLERPWETGLDGVFLSFINGEKRADSEFYANTVLDLLKPKGDTRLILMDEIGGFELENPELRSAFAGAINGNIPCMGVLKGKPALERLIAAGVATEACLLHNEELRSLLCNQGGLHRYELNRVEGVRSAVMAFLEACL